MGAMERTYVAIDLKSFYASVECVERGLDPLTTNLVVADESRTAKTICLAVTPSLKAHGISGRARLFEVEQRVREVNADRRRRTNDGRLMGRSWKAMELAEHGDWAVDYLVAMPRMALYMEYSARIYDIYLRFVAEEDIHAYSVDEVFIDITQYMTLYSMTARELTRRMVMEVLREVGITATAGIGTNLYLAKVAMDMMAKHCEADEDGVRMAELDERGYREKLWSHEPLTDFWRVGSGVANKLRMYGMTTMGDVARCSIEDEELLYRLFGVNAELLVDHAWGYESCLMRDIKAYRPQRRSLSSGQVLKRPYTTDEAAVIVEEMADGLALSLMEAGLVARRMVMTISYDAANLATRDAAQGYVGPVSVDYYGRRVPQHSHGTMMLEVPTCLAEEMIVTARELYRRIAKKGLTIRRVNIVAGDVEKEANVRNGEGLTELALWEDYEEMMAQRARLGAIRGKARRMQRAVLDIKQRYGKNAILRGTSYASCATARERNEQLGGHRA